MESRHKTPSVMAQLMGLDKEPPQQPVREKQRVLSEKYLQKVSSIGFRKKRLSHQHSSSRMSIDEKEEVGEVSKVFKTIERDENHTLSAGNRTESPDLFESKIVEQQLCDAETLIEPISAFNIETSDKPGRITKQGNLQLLQKIDSGLQRNVHRDTRLYEMLSFPKSQPELKDGTLPSRIIVLKPNDGKRRNSLKCFSSPTCENYHLGNGLLKDFSSPGSSRLYPGIKERKKFADHMESLKQSPRAFSTVSEEVSSQTGDATNRVLDVISSSFLGRNETCGKSSEMLNLVSNDDSRTGRKEILHKYWGLRKDAHLNSSQQESKVHNAIRKDCSKNMNLGSNSEKSNSLFSYSFNSNHKEESFISLHKLKKKLFGNNLSEQKPILPKLSASQPSLSCRDSQITPQTCLTNDEVKNNMLEHSNIYKDNIASPNSSIDGQVADEKAELVGRPCGNPKNQLSETTVSNLFGDIDSSSQTSYAPVQQEAPEEFHEDDSVYSVCSETQPDSLGSFEESYEPSPISVLKPPFREDISFSSQCLKVVGDDLYDSSEMDNEGLGLNVSSDEDCGDRSVGDFEEKQDFVGFLRAEESRDFSYVVDVLTEVGIFNTSLYTDFRTWHTPECPISPSIFEILETKFGKQPSWNRSDRRLLFDRINLSLMEILQPCMCIPAWDKPVSRRLNTQPNHDMIEEELWEFLVVQEKEAKKESADKMLVGEVSGIELRYHTEDIVGQIVESLIEEFAEEIVTLESF